MKRRCRLFVAVALASLALVARPAHAFDESVHYSVVYAVAVMSGYRPADAQIIARGSQSLDDNATTTAFADVVVDASRLHRELHEVATLDRAPDEITHMLPSQVFHGLTSDDNRATVEQMHIERLRRYHAQGGGSPDARRRTELVYLGEYLHLVADEVVHPHDPMIGHFAEGHSPDRAETNPAKLLNAITLIREKLDEYGGAGGHAGNPRGLQVTTSERIHETPEKLAPDPLLAAHFQILADTVVASWQRSYPDAAKRAGDVFGSGTEAARAALVAADTARMLHNNLGLEYRFYQHGNGGKGVGRFELDRDGNLLNADARQFAAASQGSFIDVAASDPGLRKERTLATLMAILPNEAIGKVVDRLHDVAGYGDAAVRALKSDAVWQVPQTLGGVALDPELHLPDTIGKPRELRLAGRGIELVTSTGTLAIDDVDSQMFATILRAVAAGQIPYLTIGAEPSDRPGYARVTYAPAFSNTREGYILYQADLRLKAVLAGLPLGDLDDGAAPLGDLVAAYPRGGSDFTRLWITCRNIITDATDGHLRVTRHGMRIQGERRLRNRVRDDSDLDDFTRSATERWDELAARFWPLRATQNLAFATGLIFWARSHDVRIDPALWFLPPYDEFTTDYAPLVARLDNELTVSGGVSLTPEDKSGSAGRQLLSQVTGLFDPSLGRADLYAGLALAALALAIAVPALFVPILALWLLLRWRIAPDAPALRRVARLWLTTCLAVLLLAAAAHVVIVDDDLGPFDRGFASFLVGVAAFPAILFWRLGRMTVRAPETVAARLAGRPGARFLTLVLATFLGTPSAASLGLAAALLAIVFTGPLPTPTSNLLLSLPLSAGDRFLEALVSRVSRGGDTAILPIPVSMQDALAPEYVSRRGADDEPQDRITAARDNVDPKMPFTTLLRIPVAVPNARSSGAGLFSPDGKLPF